jgi:hypothetical protein
LPSIAEGGAQFEALIVTIAVPVELGLATDVAVTVALMGLLLQTEGAV